MADAPVARVPKRVFRAGGGGDLLVIGNQDGPWDVPVGIRGLHCYGTRRAAVLQALSAGVSTDDLWVQPLRVTDPRPFLIAAEINDPKERQLMLATADEAGLAGVVARMEVAPTQRVWVLLDPAAVSGLGAATKCSPHDPDVVAIRNLAVNRSPALD
ncbi:MAG: hypothetical protein ACKOD2_11610 [Ilumatobacteraceae bacterium]